MGLKMSTETWHYKLVEKIYGRSYFFWGYEARNSISLCKYFWSTFWALFVYPFARILGDEHKTDWLGIAALFYGCLAIGGVFAVTFGLLWFFVPYAVLGIFIGIILVMGWLVDTLRARAARKRYEARSKPWFLRAPKGPSLLKEFLKAKKNRVCPIIEWQEPPKTEVVSTP